MQKTRFGGSFGQQSTDASSQELLLDRVCGNYRVPDARTTVIMEVDHYHQLESNEDDLGRRWWFRINFNKLFNKADGAEDRAGRSDQGRHTLTVPEPEGRCQPIGPVDASYLRILAEAESEEFQPGENFLVRSTASPLPSYTRICCSSSTAVNLLSKFWHPSTFRHLNLIPMSDESGPNNSEVIRIQAAACQSLVNKFVDGEITTGDCLQRLRETGATTVEADEYPGSREATPEGLSETEKARYRVDRDALIAATAAKEDERRKTTADDIAWGVLRAKIHSLFPARNPPGGPSISAGDLGQFLGLQQDKSKRTVNDT
ncbi:hypothetical protein FB451DRAFT_1182514 [Mycena latifolia]|nr:hypothetical protein FB451DRAFT_1182514 [Mycena latifolia]